MYIDTLIGFLTVPLLIVEFYLILKAVTTVRVAIFYKLLIGSIVMLVAGYMGEAGLARSSSCIRCWYGCLALYHL